MIPVQFIVHANAHTSHTEAATLALKGGCKWIRLHFDKDFSDNREATARQLLTLCRDHQATFVIDSDIELCKTIEADGVHLFDTDIATNEARERLGHEYIIGTTAHCFDDVKRLKRQSADYVCLGPLRGTEDTLGIEEYAKTIEEMENEEVRMPICAFGGIAVEDVLPLLRVGVQGVAVDSSIAENASLLETMQMLLNVDKEGI